jgi:Na+(H+)/acetate symporter ActP
MIVLLIAGLTLAKLQRKKILFWVSLAFNVISVLFFPTPSCFFSHQGPFIPPSELVTI